MNKQGTKPYFFIRNRETYPDLTKIPKAALAPHLELGYYLPQPIYKSWVPNWVIRLITKNR